MTNPHPIDVSGKRVLVTGGSGFLGSHVVRALHGRGRRTVVVGRKKQYDLVERTAVRRLYDDVLPEIVSHLAAVVGGIGANRRHPGRFFYENLMMGVPLMEEARLQGVEKFVAVGYPPRSPQRRGTRGWHCRYPKPRSRPAPPRPLRRISGSTSAMRPTRSRIMISSPTPRLTGSGELYRDRGRVSEAHASALQLQHRRQPV